MIAHRKFRALFAKPLRALLILSVLTLAGNEFADAQTQARYDRFESERSDRLTGGKIEQAEFEPGQPDIKFTLNVPSFRLTLWQNGREVKSYWIGVGMKEYPIYIGEREAHEVIWNPAWIPPASDWVSSHKGVKVGEIIKASDPRNPLGKIKIPLGGGYLIHQAAKVTDPGNLVSHGCVRVLRTDLYDLAEKIVAARTLPVTRKQINLAKAGTKQLFVPLDTPLPVDIRYDTLVVEGGALHIYPDVYDRRMNTIERLRDELASSGANVSSVDDQTFRQMLAQVKKGTQFVVDVKSIEQGRALEDGHTAPVIPRAPANRPAVRHVRMGNAKGRKKGAE
ncbi:MAG: L,D-transpeptidase [Acidobacteria bacterium]|nr:L,D-transpeptidase [Acidobacteriota bacterium]